MLQTTLCFSKNIFDIINCNLKKGYAIWTIFDANIPDTTGHQTTFQVPASPTVCFCTTLEMQSKENP